MKVVSVLVCVLVAMNVYASESLVSFAEMQVVQDPYKSGLQNLELANTKIQLKISEVLAAGDKQVFMFGTSKKLFSEEDVERIKSEKDFSTLNKLINNFATQGEPFCAVTIYFPSGLESGGEFISDNTLWSLKSARLTNTSDALGEPRNFELILETKGLDDSSLAIAKISCNSPYAYEKAEKILGNEVTELELLKRSFGENIHLFVEPKDVEKLLVR